jgi:hypothetical protein
MSKNNKPIDIQDLKIISKPSFLIGLISVVSIITLHIATFFNMKDDLSENIKIVKSIDSQLENQRAEFQKEFQKIHMNTAKIEGKLEILTKDDK